MARGAGAKRIKIENAIAKILETEHPMTVRQVYYQLVSRQIIENKKTEYQNMGRILVDLRKDGRIPWEWVEDRIRRPRRVSMWDDLSDFADTAVNTYRRDVWATQPRLIEVWVEKDALSGIFEDELEPYGVTLNVGRGYDGWSSIYQAMRRYEDKEATVLYFGDFDPSGMDISRSLEERLCSFSVLGNLEPTGFTGLLAMARDVLPKGAPERGMFGPELVRCALNKEDVVEYQLPHDFTKATDTRQRGFVEQYGDMAVELDALPVGVLRQRIRDEVESRLDLQALEATRAAEAEDRETLGRLLNVEEQE